MCKVRNAFTLLELVLVISIVSVLASLVIFNLRPADIFQNTNRVKKAANANDIKKAIDTYLIDNGGNLSGLLSNGATEGYYDICKSGQQSASCIDLSVLVAEGRLLNIPVDTENAGEQTTGYKLYYDNNFIDVLTAEEYIAINPSTPSPTPPSSSGGLTWSPVPAAEQNFWESVAYGNDVWVAVASTGTNRVMRSTNNGVTWTSIVAAEQNAWQSVAYGNGVWVAVASNGTNRVMRSTNDGATWSAVTAASASNWKSIAYGNGVWIAIDGQGSSTGVMRSTNDGVTWANVTTPLNIYSFDATVAYGGGVWIAMSSPYTIRSTDNGLTWSNFSVPTLRTWTSVAYSNGVWVAVSSGGTNQSIRSTDGGLTWNEITPAEQNFWESVAYGNGVWVAVSSTGTNRVMRSTDNGVTWTSIVAAEQNTWKSVAYGNGVWVAVASGGTNQVMRSTESLFCTDTDGGLNYSIKGTVHSSQCSNPQTDFCNGNVLQEQHCGPAGQCFTSAFSCDGAEVCIDGRCMFQP